MDAHNRNPAVDSARPRTATATEMGWLGGSADHPLLRRRNGRSGRCTRVEPRQLDDHPHNHRGVFVGVLEDLFALADLGAEVGLLHLVDDRPGRVLGFDGRRRA